MVRFPQPSYLAPWVHVLRLFATTLWSVLLVKALNGVGPCTSSKNLAGRDRDVRDCFHFFTSDRFGSVLSIGDGSMNPWLICLLPLGINYLTYNPLLYRRLAWCSIKLRLWTTSACPNVRRHPQIISDFSGWKFKHFKHVVADTLFWSYELGKAVKSGHKHCHETSIRINCNISLMLICAWSSFQKDLSVAAVF